MSLKNVLGGAFTMFLRADYHNCKLDENNFRLLHNMKSCCEFLMNKGYTVIVNYALITDYMYVSTPYLQFLILLTCKSQG